MAPGQQQHPASAMPLTPALVALLCPAALATKVSEVQVSASEAKQRADAQSKLVAKHAAHVEVLTEQLAQEGKQREALTAVQQATAHEVGVGSFALHAVPRGVCQLTGVLAWNWCRLLIKQSVLLVGLAVMGITNQKRPMCRQISLSHGNFMCSQVYCL